MTTNRPLVSVVTATWNRADLLMRTIDSVLAQTYAPIEYIVVDDGSTDETTAVMQRYAGRIHGVRIAHGADYGATALRCGMLKARGEFVSFLDHDDLLLPDKISKQVAALQRAPDAPAAHCGYHYADARGYRIERTLGLRDVDYVDLLCANVVWSGAPLIRREALLRAGGYDPAWCGDWRTWLNLLRRGGRMICVPEPLGVYRIAPGSMMSRLDELERSSIETLDLEYARADRPLRANDVRETAYGNMRLFLACRWYAAGDAEHGARNLHAALGHLPALRRDPARLAALLAADAASPRTADGEQFVAALESTLPQRAERLHAHLAELRSAILFRAAFRAAARGDGPAARDFLLRASIVDPGWTRRQKSLAAAIVDHALRISDGDMHQFIDVVVEALPEGIEARAALRRSLHADVEILSALLMPWMFGHGRKRALGGALLARPHWIVNRGVWSVLAAIRRPSGGRANDVVRGFQR